MNEIEKIKTRIISFKFILINIVATFSFYVNVTSVSAAAFLYKDIPYLHPYLFKSDFGGMIKKTIGNGIYAPLSFLVDGVYTAYESISKFDIFQNASIKAIMANVDKYVFDVFFIILIVAVITKIFKVENPAKVYYNAFMCLITIVLFSTIMSYGAIFKDAGMKDIDVLVGKEDYKISEKLYADNTVDVLKSLKDGKVARMPIKDMQYFDKTEVVRKKYLYDYPRVDEKTGEVVYESFDDGFMWTGVGEVRYYRYNTDFWTVNFTLLATLVVYLFAIMKHAFLMGEWFIVNIHGRFAVGKGFFDVMNIGRVLNSAFQNIIAQIILYSMMMLFPIYMSAVMTMSGLHWIAKSVLIYGFGMTAIMGSGFIANALGIQDNFGKVAGAMFMTKRAGRSISKAKDKMGNMIGSTKDTAKNIAKVPEESYNKISEDYQNKVMDAIDSPEMQETFKEGKEYNDIEDAKNNIEQSKYNEDIYDKAKQDLQGQDYKVQDEKAKLQKAEESQKVNDQAKKELYGDDYKVQAEKKKLQNAEEGQKVNVQAKKELYGDDYRVKEEKEKLENGEETQKAHVQAKKELYGEDYRDKEIKRDVIAKKEYDEKYEQAMKDVYGEDYKNYNKEELVETSAKIDRQLSESSQGSSQERDEELQNLIDKLEKGEL